MPDAPTITLEDFGCGYDTSFDLRKGNLISAIPKPNSFTDAAAPDYFRYDMAENRSEFTQLVNISGTAKGSWGVGKAKASAAKSSFFKSNSYSLYLFARYTLYEPNVFLDFNGVTVQPEALDFIKKNRTPDIERRFGDAVITGITPGWEIVIKLEIETSSEESKNSIKANASGSYGSVSAGVSFSKASASIKGHKGIKLSIAGDIPHVVMPQMTPDNVDLFIQQFPKTVVPETKRVLGTFLRPIPEIPALSGLDSARIFSARAALTRRRFITSLNSLYEDMKAWKADIEYVNSNAKEFFPEMLPMAASDSLKCDSCLKSLSDLYDNTLATWIDRGADDSTFDLRRLDQYPTSFPIYTRVPPPTIAAPAQPVVRRRDRSDPPGLMADLHGRRVNSGLKV